MSTNAVRAVFSSASNATAAIDWFANQGIDPDAIHVAAAQRGERPRPTRPGDNRRDDLTWVVTLDLDRARIAKRIAVETMKREGGTMRSVRGDKL